jgi:NAD(P)-dependent dehydrogenase (short-subunit alcohol dehydrogenase family)
MSIEDRPPVGALRGRVALVTGAGRGLGRAYARLLAARGARVVVNNRSASPAVDVVAQIRADGGEAVACVSDLGDGAAARRVVDSALEAFGRLDVLVNNAGGIEAPPLPFADIAPSDRDSVMRHNVATAWDVTAAAWPHLVAAGAGRIVLCGSPLALYGAPGFAHYAAAKGALIGLAQSLAVEGADHSVTANVLLPLANTRTDAEDSAYQRWFARHLTVDHVAAAVAWLADARCAATGEILAVAGPRVARVPLAQTPGYQDAADRFSPESIAAQWEQVQDDSRLLRFASLAELMAHWHTLYGPVGSPSP